ncbi:laccase-12-like [Cryptomeria japonica]|uniref:laccase-12-like n=1 Tax=Cryptomeria japonica TaxID=3369 RepID=UPI0025AC5D3D|nr:laccase-12-like [Cryptomeria japonica]
MLVILIGVLRLGVSANSESITRHYKFNIVTRLCVSKDIVTVNGHYPGPTIRAREGDTLFIKVTNHVEHNVTIHWHGLRQLRTGWSDGPAYITQCPIQPGKTYTYRFTITGQEGTLWWHAHISWLRATLHGAIIIYPRRGLPYPFPHPDAEVPIILGEWWNADVEQLVAEANITGRAPDISDAFTINGLPGALYNCSQEDSIFRLPVTAGKTYLLRIVNAALNNELFFSVANHILTVVAIDATYTKPYKTDILMLAPGQTTDVLLTTDQPWGAYYMATQAYFSAAGMPFDNTTATAIMEYQNSPLTYTDEPIMPYLPAFNDSQTANDFSANLRSLENAKVPLDVDRDLFLTVGLALKHCPLEKPCNGFQGQRLKATFNNISFVRPQTALLQAYYYGNNGVYTPDFPDKPALEFDYTGQGLPMSFWQAQQGTKITVLPFNSNVQIVLQNTNIIGTENHPIHLHGYNFYIVGRGIGNYDSIQDPCKFNLVDPPERNTVAVPAGGWAAIRFKADNPGVWFMHCHLEVHTSWGLAAALLVENGFGPLERLEPPPYDLPQC